MKRKTPSEAPDQTPKRPPRQDPVSCESCRRKKLKCNRQQPCSSCATRRLACVYGAGALPVSVQNAVVSQHEASMNTPSEPRKDNISVAEDTPTIAPRLAVDMAPSRHNSESLMTADWLENIHMGARVPTATPRWLRDELDESKHRESVLKPIRGNAPVGMLWPMSCRTSTATGENPSTMELIPFLPTHSEAMSLFEYYTKYVDYLYHIMIAKRAEAQITGIYRCIEAGLPVNLNHMALFFSIAASSLYLQLSIESSAHADTCSKELSYLTGAALIQSNYTAYPTIEGLQATMIIAHNLSILNPHPAVSSLFVHGAIVSQAKSLMLHCVDSTRCRSEKEANVFDVAELEIKRRLWWDLTASDWLLGFLTGPQEWTYVINPSHVNAKRPLNADDDAISAGISMSSSTATDMSFSLERLKLATVCREIVDATSTEYLQGVDISYTKVLEFDRKVQHAHNEIPEFFRLDPTSRRRFSPLYRARPAIAWQRCLLQQGYYSRLCRLHREYFIRGAREPAYSYSHVVCLQSARKVLEIKRIMDEEEPIFTPPSSVVWSVMHHVFMAVVILLLDVCFNWDDILAEKRKEEVLDACRMLSKARKSSSLVDEGINAMMSVLQRHWKSDLEQQVEPPSPIINTPHGESHPMQPTSDMSAVQSAGIELKETTVNLSNINMIDEYSGRQLEDIWSEMLDNSGNYAFEATDWTGLLNELTNATVPCG